MIAQPRKVLLAAAMFLAALTVSALPCMAQEPEPPMQDELPLPDSEVPVLKDDIAQPFNRPGDEVVLDNLTPQDDQTEIEGNDSLLPQDDQLPGYTSPAARFVDSEPPSYNESLSQGEDPVTASPLTRRQQRRLQREARKAPIEVQELRRDVFTVSGGKLSGTFPDREVNISADTVRMVAAARSDSLAIETVAAAAPAPPDSASTLSPRERRAYEKMMRRADTTLYRHSPLFRDTIKVTPLTAISLVVPGFGQLYNGQYWKIPVLYAVTGTSIYLGIRQHQYYRHYRDEYDFLTSRADFIDNRKLIDPVQTRMIQHNTWQQLFFGAAIGTYLYFLGDAVVNYPSSRQNNVKTATTLSVIFPGAGQIYNGSFWKVPLVVGGFASMVYVIDWNNRGYQRYSRALRLETDNDPDSHSEFWNDRTQSLYTSLDQMRNYRKLYRRNRDLSIILTAAFYLLNVMDAHVDAHLKSFDMNDDLAAVQMRLHPVMTPFYSVGGGLNYTVGLGLSLTF